MMKILDFLRRPQKRSRMGFLIFLLALTLAFSISVWGRFDQLNQWKQYSGSFFTADGTPMMTTLDAYKFIRHAKEFNEGVFDTSKLDPMIFYPDDSPYPDPVPLLSVLLDFFTPADGSYYMTALFMIPFISSLFIISLGLFGYAAGYPAAGILAGLITTFAPMFYGRSGMGRFDTDGLNLFFIFMTALFVLLASKSKERWQVYLYSALTGLTIAIFYWWYHHGMFNLFFLAVLGASLYFAKVRLRDIAGACVVYLICTNPFFTVNAFSQFYHAIHVYIFPIKETSQAIFPNVYETISEAQKNTPLEALSFVISNPIPVAIGLFGSCIFAVAHFKAAIPLAPVVALALMTFVSAGRFSMFLAPVAGFGLGYLITLLINHIRIKFSGADIIRNVAIYVSAALFFILITVTGNNAFGNLSGPSINPNTYSLFMMMKEKLPKNSAIYSWWDYGLAITDATRFPVFHSGMTQETPKTWVIAKSLTANQRGLYNIASYLDTYGIAEIKLMAEDNKTLEEISDRMENYSEGPMNNADYILLTEDMLPKLSPISYLATWNKVTGKADPMIVESFACAMRTQGQLTCTNGYTINLDTGIMNNKIPIKEFVQTIKGNTVTRKTYNYSLGYFVVADETKRGMFNVYIMEERTFATAFIQLYLLNSPNDEYFSLDLDNYPYGRLFRLKMKATNDTAK